MFVCICLLGMANFVNAQPMHGRQVRLCTILWPTYFFLSVFGRVDTVLLPPPPPIDTSLQTLLLIPLHRHLPSHHHSPMPWPALKTSYPNSLPDPFPAPMHSNSSFKRPNSSSPAFSMSPSSSFLPLPQPLPVVRLEEGALLVLQQKEMEIIINTPPPPPRRNNHDRDQQQLDIQKQRMVRSTMLGDASTMQ